LYPHFHSMIFPIEETKLNQNIETIAEILKNHNYTTLWIAGRNNNHLPLNRGFERGFDEFYDSYNGSSYWNNAHKWLKNNSNKKFFMFLHIDKVHAPYTPSNQSILKFTNEINQKIISSERVLINRTAIAIAANPATVFTDSFIQSHGQLIQNISSIGMPKIQKLSQNFSNVHTSFFASCVNLFWSNVNRTDKSDMEYVRILYDSEIYELDQDFRSLLATIEEQNLTENTIIVITSDHGEELMEHGSVDHGSLYEECTHIPLIIKAATLPAGLRFGQLVESVDIMPTILGLVGIAAPDYAQGENLIPLLEEPHYLSNRTIYAENFNNIMSIRYGDWKYITSFEMNSGTCIFSDGQLYRLSEDPSEQKNIESVDMNVASALRNKLISEFRVMEEKLKGKVSPVCTMPR
jgi:arylsulfatase A-like enzyme